MSNRSTYRAVHATAPGKLELTEKPLLEPPEGHVRLRVEACGVCHSDSATVEGALPIEWPRVPGHEAVGVIDAVGAGVVGWSIGQRVGVGFLGGSCGYCDRCRQGDLVTCRNQGYTGVQRDGGYAESMISKASALVSIPGDVAASQAAPLLCAGVTTFNALRESPARAGDLVAIIGIGGLGHLGVQYARQMGFEVVAIGRGPDVDGLSRKLGAHHYVDGGAEHPGDALARLGGAALVLSTASAGTAVAQSIRGLAPRGRVVVLGASAEPIEASSLELLSQCRSIQGSLTGDPGTSDATIRFSKLTGVAALVETFPLERAPEAYARMMKGQVRLRAVLTM